MNRFEGDPRLYQSVDGSYLKWVDGQSEMDQGLENQAEISLLTKPGWTGNFFLSPESQIGSDYIDSASGSITVTTLNNIRQAGEAALSSAAFGKVTATITNPKSTRIKAVFLIEPPGKNIQELILSGNGQNWINQAVHPAYKRS